MLNNATFPDVVIFRMEAPSPPVDPSSTRLGLKAPHELIGKAFQAAIKYDGHLTTNLVMDPTERWFKMDNLRHLLRSA
jgi:hypothetical protein